MSEFIKHIWCAKCGSSDAGSVYTDGHFYCFKCGAVKQSMDEEETPTTTRKKRSGSLIPTEIKGLRARGISEATCQRFNYGFGRGKHGKLAHVANYYNAAGRVVAQKLRYKDKSFSFIGDTKSAVLFGQQCWAGGGKRLVITEGEIDALSVAEVFPGWPVVSVQNGAQAALKSLKAQLEWLESFETIILCFDMDGPGQDAAKECAALFTPGKCKIAPLPLKDANEMLMADQREELRKAILFNAKVYRPDGIICGTDPKIRDHVISFVPHSDASYPWPHLNEMLFGMRMGELATHTAGTGIGKTTVCREIAYHLGVTLGQKVGVVSLEESVCRYGLLMTSIAANRRLHLTDSDLSREEREAYYQASIGNGNFYLYDHWGSLAANNLMSRLRYLVKGCGCPWIILDHLSIVVSGMDDGDNERKTIDKLMTDLRSLVEETGCGLHLISHLSRKHDGKSHEEGATISLRDLRGSHSIVQLSDIVLGYERNQQDEESKNRIRVRKLKDRYTGQTGVVGELEYNEDTGRVVEPDGFTVETVGTEEPVAEDHGF